MLGRNQKDRRTVLGYGTMKKWVFGGVLALGLIWSLFAEGDFSPWLFPVVGGIMFPANGVSDTWRKRVARRRYQLGSLKPWGAGRKKWRLIWREDIQR